MQSKNLISYDSIVLTVVFASPEAQRDGEIEPRMFWEKRTVEPVPWTREKILEEARFFYEKCNESNYFIDPESESAGNISDLLDDLAHSIISAKKSLSMKRGRLDAKYST